MVRVTQTPGEVWWENKRAYGTFRRGRYLFPIDEQENDRLDIFHKFFKVVRRDVLTEGLPANPGREPRILDLGTGTGIWAIELGEMLNDQAEIWGLDLNYSQPASIPRSCKFPHAIDIEEPWSILNDKFDLVHIRMLNGSIGNWPALYAKAFEHLQPGGKIEQVEIDFMPRPDERKPFNPDIALLEWYRLVMDATERAGTPMRLAHNTKARLEQAGFTDVVETKIMVPFSPWCEDRHGQECARWFGVGMKYGGIEGMSLAPLTRYLNMSVEDVRSLNERVDKEFTNLTIRAYCYVHIWVGTKPTTAPVTAPPANDMSSRPGPSRPNRSGPSYRS